MRRSLSPRPLGCCLGLGVLCLVMAEGHAQKTKAKSPAVTAPVEHMPTFTLAQATAGLRGPGPLVATLELVQGDQELGTLRCELFPDQAPQTVANFVGLARGLRPWKHPLQGKWVQTPLYDGNWVHRTVPDYLIQAGDPQCSTVADCGGRHGQGDPGFVLENELSTVLRFDRGGRLAMAQKGKGIAGSQFFITERETPWLNGLYAIFGQCNPVQLIQTVARVETQPLDVPKVPVKIRRVLISLGTPGTATAPGKK